MITNYTTYIKESKYENEFLIKFVFEKEDNKYIISYNIDFLELMKPEKKPIYFYLNQLVFKLLNKTLTDVNQEKNRSFVVSKEEIIYLCIKLQSLKYNIYKRKDINFNFFFLKKGRSDIDKYITITKELNYNTLKDDFKTISLNQNDIDDFFIDQIQKYPNTYLSGMRKIAYSKKVINMFKHLEDADKFDLL
jgi:hypothetical protein